MNTTDTSGNHPSKRTSKGALLRNHPSTATEQVARWVSHPFFDRYAGGTISQKRVEDRYVMLYQAFLIELAEGKPTDLGLSSLMELASGKWDSVLRKQHIDAEVASRLDQMNRVFGGLTFSRGQFFLVLYQAARLVAYQGYDFRQSSRGCLTPWAQTKIQLFEEVPQWRETIMEIGTQRRFWLLFTESLLTQPGLMKGSEYHVF